jgi:hypothetical protein
MTMIVSEIRSAVPARGCDLIEVEGVVEDILRLQLAREREQVEELNAGNLAAYATALDDFQGWCDHYGLPMTPHVCACFMLELHKYEDAGFDELKTIAGAFLLQHRWDVVVPITAALDFCRNAPRALEARKVVH